MKGQFHAQNKENNFMKNKLMELTEISRILGYKDLRSINKWCSNNGIQIIILGKKRYVTEKSVDFFLNSQIVIGYQKNQNYPDEILNAIRDDDLSRLAELIEAPTTSKVKEEYNQKKSHSKKSEELLNKFRIA